MEEYERMKRREQDKKERAKQAMPQNTEPPTPLFGEPKRVIHFFFGIFHKIKY